MFVFCGSMVGLPDRLGQGFGARRSFRARAAPATLYG
jgi:hypothetical protein